MISSKCYKSAIMTSFFVVLLGMGQISNEN